MNRSVVATDRYSISQVSLDADGTLRFVRSDEALPMPIDPRTEPARQWVPLVDDLNRYTLKVTGLSAAKYDVLIDDQLAASVERGLLTEGWNMADIKAPIAAQATQVMQLVLQKNAVFFRCWKEILLTPSRRNQLPGADNSSRSWKPRLNKRRPRPHSFALRPRE